MTPESVIDFVKMLVLDPDYNSSYNSMVDLRESEMKYDILGLRQALEDMFQMEGFLNKRKVAYITISASQVVPPMIMMHAEKYDFPMEIKVLSSIPLGLEWLGVKDISEDEYKLILDEMCRK